MSPVRTDSKLASLLESTLPERTREILNLARGNGRSVEWLVGPGRDFADLIVPNPQIVNPVSFVDSEHRSHHELDVIQGKNALGIIYADLESSKRPGHDLGFVVGDQLDSSKRRLEEAFGLQMHTLTKSTKRWMGVRDLVVIPSKVADGPGGAVLDVAFVTTRDMAWSKLAWDLIHKAPTAERLREEFKPGAVFLAIPGLRPTLFRGTQTTIFDRGADDGVITVYPTTSYQGLGMSKKPIFVCLSEALVSKGKGFLAHATLAVLRGETPSGAPIEKGYIYFGKSGHGKTEFRFIRHGEILIGKGMGAGVGDIKIHYPRHKIPSLTAAGDDGVVFRDFNGDNGYGVAENSEKEGSFDRPSASFKTGDLPENDQILAASSGDPFSVLTLSMNVRPQRSLKTFQRILEGDKPHSNPRMTYSWSALAKTPALKDLGIGVTTDPVRFDTSIFGMGVVRDFAVVSWANKLPICTAYALLLAGISKTKSVSVTEGQGQDFGGIGPDKFGTMEGFTTVPDVAMANRVWDMVSSFHKVSHWACPIGWVGPDYKVDDNEAELLLRDTLFHLETGDSSWELVPGRTPFFGLRPKTARILGQDLPSRYNDPLQQFPSVNAFDDAAAHILTVIRQSINGLAHDNRVVPAARAALSKALNLPVFVSSPEEAMRIFEDLNNVPLV